MKRKVLATIIIINMSLVGCNHSTTNRNNERITVEEAKEIALNNANLTSDKVSFVRTEFDSENGIEKYDIEFNYGNKEYDYEINAIDGKIIGYDEDIEDYNITNNEGTNNKTESQKSGNTTENQQQNNSNENQQQIGGETEITIEEAKQIALKHANLASDKVSFLRSELDIDDGVKKYEIEFNYNSKEYSYEIDAITGNILSYEQD